MGLEWMAWTWPTAAFFAFIGACLIGMTVWEWAVPGGGPRRGILGLDTTRGDRLFIALLGSAFILLLWLGVAGAPLWIPIAIALAYAGLVFRFV